MSGEVRVIQSAGTSTSAFIAPIPEGSSEPKRVRSWGEFTQTYGLVANGERVGANLAEAVYGFFANGGFQCYVAGTTGDGLAAYTSALAALEKVREVNIVAVPELWTSRRAGDRQGRRGTLRAWSGNRMALLHTKKDAAPEEARKTPELFGLDETEAAFTTLYYPWLKVPGHDGTARVVPPSGHIAGIWARIDAERGVFKAPANQNVWGVNDLQTLLTDDENGQANEAGVNCLRVFPEHGLLVWGARTLCLSDDWKHLNVRRLVNFLTDSIQSGTAWTAFEPNGQQLWNCVTSFLTDQWRQGALVGQTPGEASYVICDDTNNKPDTVKSGQVVIDIGVAAAALPSSFLSGSSCPPPRSSPLSRSRVSG